ncbi:hypothetical protein EJ03DRAFT_79493 [Teratosphaeria nubilosa]|uniref:Uncharacterized protein n=1 Tax=Teratosphaeria nubilosa TaxID=161662 RepID=A0A6G1LB57_9PEZI|nr:hypothetical protein EJ03DRAFT_79493 [Teratosphaeria nubilosa]
MFATSNLIFGTSSRGEPNWLPEDLSSEDTGNHSFDDADYKLGSCSLPAGISMVDQPTRSRGRGRIEVWTTCNPRRHNFAAIAMNGSAGTHLRLGPRHDAPTNRRLCHQDNRAWWENERRLGICLSLCLRHRLQHWPHRPHRRCIPSDRLRQESQYSAEETCKGLRNGVLFYYNLYESQRLRDIISQHPSRRSVRQLADL